MAKRPRTPERRDLIGIGASAGGIEALTRLLATLPPDLPASVAIVIHLGVSSASSLPALLGRSGPLPAEYARDGTELRHGAIFVAPPDLHMIIDGDRLRLMRGPRQNHVRPAIDPFFRSVARTRGRRFVGVVLSGMLDDGSAGLVAVRRAGGVAVVQDPDDALFHDMPKNALETAGADYTATSVEMGPLLERLVRERLGEAPMRARHTDAKPAIDLVAQPVGEGPDGTPRGRPSMFACPECGGVLFESPDETQLTCRVGHAYSPEALLANDNDRVEAALWAGLRALEEASVLSLRLEQRARERMASRSATQFAEQAREADARAIVLRRLLQGSPQGTAHRPGRQEEARARRPKPRRPNRRR